VADKKLAAILNAVDPDLSRFQKRGGKLILYHGWSDAGIAPQNTVDYYNSVVKQMGAAAAASFVQLYMVPGMDHCSGGPGPNDFGQFSPGQGINQAMETWVEQGTAPVQLTVSKKQDGQTTAKPLCPYPQVTKWICTARVGEDGSSSCTFVCSVPPR
jgi:feruloyl esterase